MDIALLRKSDDFLDRGDALPGKWRRASLFGTDEPRARIEGPEFLHPAISGAPAPFPFVVRSRVES